MCCLLFSDESRLTHTGPESEKRPADVICNAVRVTRIATSEEPEALEIRGLLA